MREQFGFLLHYNLIVKFAFPLYFDLIPRSCYLLQTRNGAIIPFGESIAPRGDEVTERLACVPALETSEKLIRRICLGTVTVHTDARYFWQPVLASVSALHYLDSVCSMCSSHIMAFLL
jgi:hypothetical protein